MMVYENSGNHINYKLILEELTSLKYWVKLPITELLEIHSMTPIHAEEHFQNTHIFLFSTTELKAYTSFHGICPG